MTNQSITNMFGYLSNEARNSMHAIVGLMEMRVDEPHNPNERANLDICRASADRLLRSIDDLQALFSDEPLTPGSPEEFELQTVVSDIIELVNLSAAETDHQLVFETVNSSGVLICDDRRTLELMLTRLLDSALKFTPTGNVRVSLIADQKEMLVGVTPEDSSTIRQLADWLKMDPEQIELDGTGQVLTAVNAMVAGKWIRARNGSARIIPNLGGPASLAVCLPLPRAAVSREAPSVCQDASQILNILVVEDCDESYALAELLLRNERLWRACDGNQAIDMVKRRRFDVVFMDVHLPGTDGYGAIRAIRDWETETGNARTPMVVLSADDVGTQIRSAAQSGCSGFLRKPVGKTAITALLERLKALHRLAT